MKFYNLKKISLWLLLIFIFPAFVSLATIGYIKSKSLYQIAVENGFVGTEQEWIESLKGKSAYEIALENGFVGTEQDWLYSLHGSNGVNGKDGTNQTENTYSMYLNAKANGEIGDMTYVEFLNSVFGTSDEQVTANLSKSLLSVVSVYAFTNPYQTINPNNSGSGVIYKLYDNGDALILTNYHVAYGSSSLFQYYQLSLYGQENNFIPAELYGASKKYDLAILKVSKSSKLLNSNAQAVTLNETPVALGQVCYAIGDTSKYGLSLTRGVISVESEIVSMTIGGSSMKYREIRHDSYIFHGNSGGGLFDIDGKLIGITNGGKENTLLNYAIPINIVEGVAENLIRNKVEGFTSKIRVFNTGIENNLTTSETISIFDSETSKINIQETVTISSIDENSLIANLNTVAVGDEIVSITYREKTYSKEQYTLRTYTLSELLLSSNENDEIIISLKRANAEDNPTYFSITVTLSADYTTIYN